MNKDLKNDFYRIPPELLSTLNDNLKHSDKGMSGYKRLKSLCDEKGVGYQQAKKIKHEMENGMEPEVYKLIGGDELLNWVSTSLASVVLMNVASCAKEYGIPFTVK